MPNPIGQYTKVHVYDIQNQGGSLTPPATGTYSPIGVFSCGDFANDDRPTVNSFYNITGQREDEEGNPITYEFPGVKCITSNQVSQFQ